MPGITHPIQDVMQRLRGLQPLNGEQVPQPLYVRLYNNQVQDELNGLIDPYPKPAAFVEPLPATWQQLGLGVKSTNLVFRIHLVHTFIDAQDGTGDQDLTILHLRDMIDSVDGLSLYTPTGCSALVKLSEQQDFNHGGQVYHFTADYGCHFIDSKGSPYDACAGRYIALKPPVDVQINVDYQPHNINITTRYFQPQFQGEFE